MLSKASTDVPQRITGHPSPKEHVLQLICVVEFPYTVVSVVLLDETLEDMPGDETCDLGENILAFVHNQRGLAHKITSSFQIAVVKELI